MNAAIVVPIYKPRGADLKWFERISLQRCLEVFGGKYPIVFVAPNDQINFISRDLMQSISPVSAATIN